MRVRARERRCCSRSWRGEAASPGAVGLSAGRVAAAEAGETDLESLLPDRWAASHPEHVLQHRLDESRRRAARQKATRSDDGPQAAGSRGVRISGPREGARLSREMPQLTRRRWVRAAFGE